MSYNEKLCDQKHGTIDREFTVMIDRIKTVEGRLWTIILLLVFNFGGLIANIVISYNK